MHSPTNQNPRLHPEQRNRHNPNAWQACSVPPFPNSDRHNPAFDSWQAHSSPSDAHNFYTARAKGLLTFARFTLDKWGEQAFNAEGPTLDLTYNDVQGLVELLSVIGETIDLSVSAAAAMQVDTAKH